VSLSPSSQSAESGTSLGYTITIRNNDDSNCDNSSFNLASVVPSGWSAGLSKSSLSLAPGATGYASLTVTSSSSASAKSYGIQIEVSNSSESLHAASANATYTVVESCVVNAPSLTLSQTSQSGDAGATLSYAFSLRNNDSAACGDSTFNLTRSLPPGWSASITSESVTLTPGSSVNGTLQVTSSTSATAGDYTIGLQATDSSTSGHNASDTTTYVVNEPAPVCTAATPGVSISPASQSAEAGASLGYTVTITNNDDSYCDSSSFNLASVVQAGLSAGFSKSSLNLAPGATGSANLTVTSLSSASAGSYGIQVNVTDSSESLHTASASANYTVLESCIVNAPSLALSQSSLSGDAGDTVSYAFSLRNNDGSACGNSTFSLTRSLPAGWSGSVTPASITLSAGGSTNGTLQVTSAATASPGNYSVGLQVSDSSTPGHNASDTATYVVNEPVDILDSEAPTTPTGLAASANFKQVSLTWSPSSDNVAVSGYLVWRDGANIAYTTDTSYTDTTGADGESYTYWVSAMDLAGNESAQSAAVISGKTVKTKGGGKTSDGGTTDGGTGGGDTTTNPNKGKGKNK
jgi:uncharacterized membrane protein